MRHDFPFARAEGLLARLYRPFLRRKLFRLGAGAIISPFATLEGMGSISIDAGGYISRRSLLTVAPAPGPQSSPSTITIGENSYIGRGCTLSACGTIAVGRDVTFGDNVYCSAGQHGFAKPGIRILDQPLSPGRVTIGDGAWIGYGAFISTTNEMTIGAGAIVAANAVVTRSVPDLTMVAGIPARPIKRFDEQSAAWIAV